MYNGYTTITSSICSLLIDRETYDIVRCCRQDMFKVMFLTNSRAGRGSRHWCRKEDITSFVEAKLLPHTTTRGGHGEDQWMRHSVGFVVNIIQKFDILFHLGLLYVLPFTYCKLLGNRIPPVLKAKGGECVGGGGGDSGGVGFCQMELLQWHEGDLVDPTKCLQRHWYSAHLQHYQESSNQWLGRLVIHKTCTLGYW